MRDQRRVRHAGNVPQLLYDTAIILRAFLIVVVCPGRQVELGGDYVLRVEAFIDGEKARETADQQAGDDQERGAERRLERDEKVANDETLPPLRGAARSG